MSASQPLPFCLHASNYKRYLAGKDFAVPIYYVTFKDRDIARFIAHATEDKATFPFYMNDYQKELFINRVYSGLHKKPKYEQYIRDINLALFNEYVEFIEAGEDEKNWYAEQAEKLAREILKNDISLSTF